MSFPYNDILNIPLRSILDKRITKAFFLKNFKLTAAEKKLLNNTIDSMEWLASIKPTNANIPMLKNTDYIYEEVQIMLCTVRNDLLQLNADKCISLFQKHIPYQILLIVEDDNEFILNTCDKRINKADISKRTIEHYYTTNAISKLYKNKITKSLFEVLDFAKLDKTNLETTYNSYTKAIIQQQTASITGRFDKRTKERSEEDMILLELIEKLKSEIGILANRIHKEPQINMQVELNIEIHRKRQQIQEIKDKLSNE